MEFSLARPTNPSIESVGGKFPRGDTMKNVGTFIACKTVTGNIRQSLFFDVICKAARVPFAAFGILLLSIIAAAAIA